MRRRSTPPCGYSERRSRPQRAPARGWTRPADDRGPGPLAGSGMSSKVTTLRDAVAAHLQDGETLAIEGFTHLISFAAAHEIIRQGRRGLTLARLTPDLVYDQMVAAGCP